ncbi:TetR/AcrR family transcriptional regulator [Massilia sp. CF038]|uniref:TetR/AcrR family transcriptional regulator n=1 Tax=Massilia sp. CF038 TaxID=1881045 RepID=UPI0009173205|nr:TetR/AcrR family transcriptional regulator [Massilia sp. CF038]SHH41066.1 transcriptional regulator, TetR family [Massilia sp. CF038]
MNAPQRLTDRKRLAILEAAADQFRRFGFEATSMDKIAAMAGVSKRTVYNHFPSKDELFAETLMQLFHSSAAALDLPYRKDVPLREQLLAMMRLKVGMLADRNFLDLARVAIAEAVVAPERARPIIARINEREEGVTTWIRAAQADGRLKPGDPLFAATLLHGQVKAMAFWPQVTMGAPPLAPELMAPLVDAAVSMFLAYFANDTA